MSAAAAASVVVVAAAESVFLTDAVLEPQLLKMAAEVVNASVVSSVFNFISV